MKVLDFVSQVVVMIVGNSELSNVKSWTSIFDLEKWNMSLKAMRVLQCVFKITDCTLLWVWLECQMSLWSDEHLLLKTMFLFLLFFLPYDFTDLNGFHYCSHHKEARVNYCVKRKLRCYFLWSTSKVIIWCRIIRKVWIVERDEKKKKQFFSVSIQDMHCQTYTG